MDPTAGSSGSHETIPQYVPIRIYFLPCSNAETMVPLVDNLPFGPMVPWFDHTCLSVLQVLHPPASCVTGVRQLVPKDIFDSVKVRKVVPYATELDHLVRSSQFLIMTSYATQFDHIAAAGARLETLMTALSAGRGHTDFFRHSGEILERTSIGTVLFIAYVALPQSKAIHMASWALNAEGKFLKEQQASITLRYGHPGSNPESWKVAHACMVGKDKSSYFGFEYTQVTGLPATPPSVGDFLWTDSDLQIYAAGVYVLHEGFPELDNSNESAAWDGL